MSQYSTYYMQSQGERFSLVEAGVSEKVLAKTARDMGFDEDKLRAILRLRRSHRSTKGTSANGVFRTDEASGTGIAVCAFGAVSIGRLRVAL
jgi:hypothetical protein